MGQMKILVEKLINISHLPFGNRFESDPNPIRAKRRLVG